MPFPKCTFPVSRVCSGTRGTHGCAGIRNVVFPWASFGPVGVLALVMRYDLRMGMFEVLDGMWVWMTPGVNALAVLAPLGTPVVAAVAAAAAIRTFRLRVRVDHADQWWKQLNFAVDKSLGQHEVDKRIGDIILSALQNPESPDRPVPWSNNRPNLVFKSELRAYKKQMKCHRKSLRRRWKISDREEQMLVDIADAFTLQALGTPVINDDRPTVRE